MPVSFEVILNSKGKHNESGLVVTAGQTISGKVRIVVAGFPTRGGKLSVRVKGTEVGWVGSSRRESNLFSKSIVARDLSRETMWPGTYNIPFELVLPASLPSTTAFEIKRTGFNIFYEIRVQLWKQSFTCPLSVEASPLATENVSHLWGPCGFEIWTNGLMRRGMISLCAHLVNTHLGRGHHLELSLCCRNHSIVAIERVDVQLVERINWTVDQQIRPLVLVTDVDVRGLQKSEALSSHIIHHEWSSVSDLDRQGMVNDMRSDENVLRLQIPQHSLNSYHGELVQVSHTLEIKLVTKVHSYSACIPIRIGVPSQLEESAALPVGMVSSSCLEGDAIAVLLSPNCEQSVLHIPLVEAVEAYTVNAEGVPL